MKIIVILTAAIAIVSFGLSNAALLKVSKLVALEKPIQTPAIQAPTVLCEDNNDQNTCHTP